MKKFITFYLIIGILLWNGSCSKTDPIPNDVDQEILEVMETHQIPSVVACVVKGDEIVWEGTYGYAYVEDGIPATRHSLYTIMSIGKVILSTAVFQLWENGEIDLQADINQYLPFEVRNPNFPDDKITPYLLLNHRSSLAWPEDDEGIPDFNHFYSFEDPPPISEWLPQYILPGGTHYRTWVWKEFRPGEMFLYSNIGASLLALVVEEITGEDYRDYCRKYIFDPLEMHNTAFRISRLNKNHLTTPYNHQGNPMYYYTCRHYPAGFISSDIEDFSHYVIAMLNKGEYRGKRILKASTMDKMLELQDATSGTANLWVHCLGDCIGHLGGGLGFSTWAEWHFDHDRAMFIFSNKVNGTISNPGRIYELVKYQAYKY